MDNSYLNKITNADCLEHLATLKTESIDLFLSDIPYGINLDEWDVLHNNTNSALLGQSPAQFEKTAFKRRGKPINGWSSADRNSGKEYQDWCESWAKLIFRFAFSKSFINCSHESIFTPISVLNSFNIELLSMYSVLFSFTWISFQS